MKFHPEMQRKDVRVSWLLLCAVAVLLSTAYVRQSEADAGYILDLSQMIPGSTGDDATLDKETTAAFYQGIQAYLKYDTSVSVHVDAPSQSTVADALKNAGKYVAAIGPYGDMNVANGLSASTDVVMYGAITGGTAYSAWNNNLLFNKMTPEGELLMLLNWAVAESHVKSIGFFYTTGVSCGEDLYKKAQDYLGALGIASYLVPYTAAHSASFDKSAFDKYVATGNLHAECPENLMTDSTMLSRDILGSFFQQVLIGKVLQANKSTFKGKCYIATSVPPVTSTSAAMTAFLGALSTAKSDHGKGNFMYLGFTTMYALAYATKPQSCSTASIFKSTVFSYYDRAVFKDYVMGFVGPDCGAPLKSQGAVCQCNQMQSQKVWMVQVNTDLTQTNLNVIHTNLEPTCGIMGKMGFGTRAVLVNFADDTLLSSVYTLGVAAKLASDTTTPSLKSTIQAENKFIFNTAVSSTYSSYSATYTVDMVIGPVTTAFNQGSNTILWSPIYSAANINMYRTNEYHVTPTYAQDILAFYQYLNSISNTAPITGIVRNAADDASTYYMEEGLVNLAVYFSKFADVFVERIGDGEDIASVVEFMSLSYNSDAKVYLPYRTLSLIFDAAKTGFSSVVSRVFTDSSIPYWTLSQYNKHPITAEVGVSGNLIKSNPYAFRGNFPTINVGVAPVPPNFPITADGVTVGPFYPKGELDQLTGKKSIQGRNWGATKVMIIPLATAFGDTTVTFSSYPDASLYEHLTYQVRLAMEISENARTAQPLVAKRSKGSLVLTRKPITTTTSSEEPLDETDEPSTNYLGAVEDPTTDEPTSEEPSTTSSKKPSSTSTSSKRPRESSRLRAKKARLNAHSDPGIYTTKKPVNKQKIMAGVLWTLMAVLLIACVALLVIYILTNCCHSNGAPTDKKKPITIIQTLTSLTEYYQEASKEYMNLMRELIKKHKCYEAKCDGNRFIIVSKSPFHAVQLAADIQPTMLQYDWKTEKFDAWYKLVEEKLQVENYTNYTPILSPEEYQALWNGPRVRVGVHTGICGVHYASSFKRYRYFGAPVKTSLFVEEMGQGGQSLVTEATWDFLAPEEISSLDYTYLGPHNVRGEDHPVSLYLLNAVPGRVFGPLRRPPESIGDELGGKDETSPVSAFHAFALRRCYENFPPDQRVEEILPMARVWGVLIPPRGDSTDEDYANRLIDLLAEKISEADRPEAGGDGESTFDNTTIMMNMGENTGFDTETNDQIGGPHSDAFTSDTVEVGGFGTVAGFDDDDDDDYDGGIPKHTPKKYTEEHCPSLIYIALLLLDTLHSRQRLNMLYLYGTRFCTFVNSASAREYLPTCFTLPCLFLCFNSPVEKKKEEDMELYKSILSFFFFES
eukprot:gene8068-5620_t